MSICVLCLFVVVLCMCVCCFVPLMFYICLNVVLRFNNGEMSFKRAVLVVFVGMVILTVAVLNEVLEA